MSGQFKQLFDSLSPEQQAEVTARVNNTIDEGNAKLAFTDLGIHPDFNNKPHGAVNEKTAAKLLEHLTDETPPATHHYQNPTPEMLNDPMWLAIWNELKTWDINVPDQYSGYMGATGNHATAIYLAIRAKYDEVMAETYITRDGAPDPTADHDKD